MDDELCRQRTPKQIPRRLSYALTPAERARVQRAFRSIEAEKIELIEDARRAKRRSAGKH